MEYSNRKKGKEMGGEEGRGGWEDTHLADQPGLVPIGT